MAEPNQNPIASTQVLQQIMIHQCRLRALVRCLLIRSADVEDILQEVNAVLCEKASEFQDGTDFWAWASRIARFKALNQVRKYGRERLVFDDNLLDQLAEEADRRLVEIDRRREALDRCLKKLPPPQRQLVDLRYSGRHAIESISEMIGRPAGSVRQTLYRIRVTLQACIEGQLKVEHDAI